SSRLDVAAPSAPPAVEETAAQEPAAAHRPPLFMVPTPSGGVVSRDGLLNELLDRLREPGDGPLGVVAAVGAGGFGKTTLAVDACRRPDVRDELSEFSKKVSNV